ncbi:hypothetical protein OH76DRAFT_1451074 [Lentinus brumalis]|uniref:RING-type domain-containing protein n=1 Tax=Lentinus brumalis TaxID=2498619 RepID=A0A371CGI0_9APHY|nr:hypothetical protein OH76DRAFT_1451074 [Polyporus brumalis]
MHVNCPVCFQPTSQEAEGCRPVRIVTCNHVVCHDCFERLCAMAKPCCPFRCNIVVGRPAPRLRREDGEILEISLKPAEPLEDGVAALSKYVASLSVWPSQLITP